MQDLNESKYKILVLGGCGFIGRHLVEYIITNNYASKVVVVDKIPAQLCWFNSKHQDIFSNELVEFKSANLINATSCKSIFEYCRGFDFAINLAAETRLGQTDQVYNDGIYKLSLNCAKEATKSDIKKYVEISSSHLSDVELNEDENRLNPWTYIGKYKLNVERELSEMNLNHVVLRPALVYGTADRSSNGVTHYIMLAAVYKHLNEVMKLLWNGDLKINTVHVEDVVRAIWFVCVNNNTIGETYNVVDKGNTTLGLLTRIISDIFGINCEFMGNATSMLAIKTMGLNALIDQINDKHMTPWVELCSTHNIQNTPLNPFIYSESLKNRNLFINGDKLENLGFVYQWPQITKQLLLTIIDDYIKMKLFPQIHC